MGIADVRGLVSFNVNVQCPWCNGHLNLTRYPYDHADDFKALGMALFGSIDTPAKWEGLDFEYKCNHCKEHFILTKLEY